jgi:hypothetical protein
MAFAGSTVVNFGSYCLTNMKLFMWTGPMASCSEINDTIVLMVLSTTPSSISLGHVLTRSPYQEDPFVLRVGRTT